MSNYKWVKMSDEYVQLRKEDFSQIPSFEVNNIDTILMKKFEDNGIDSSVKREDFLEDCSYVLSAVDQKVIMITAPLYELNLDTDSYVLIAESYTDEAIDPAEYELVKKTYSRCVEEVASEQAEVFEKLFMEKTLDGISSIVTISSNPYEEPNYFYEQYIPKGYIKACEKNYPFTCLKHDVVFIKKMDAKGQAITIKVPDFYKGLVIGKGGENIKKIANQINAKRINVI